ncbi:YhcN/YlaJ family sporulation lipoprotein [Alkalihalobacterium alkalinitrilicum]|uniref:YhcN/YlaJ family sporulation lipoprotein n=1 Tax=Alkalihalobacterium alkalinitrilicum TaxID=427920 RepID=UPI001303B8CE|nr:YhcN/YlaJ family sporulation lipoprotein [Alkalihalobacterium alkalinitrilicum]
MKKRTLVIVMLLLILTIVSGCGVVEQKHPMGANHFRDEGFSGFGTHRVRHLEGPVSDMMVPDGTPKGRTDRAHLIAEDNMYYTSERNLGFKSQGTNRSGARIYNNAPGTLDDKYILSDQPHLKRKKIDLNHQNISKEEQVRQQLMAIENIEDVYIFTHDGMLVIGIESAEQNRPKLIREVEEVIAEEVELENVRIATDRRNVNRIRAIVEGGDTGEPFQGIGGQLSEIRHNFYDN